VGRRKGEVRKTHNEELNDLYSTPNIIWVIKKNERVAGHASRVGERSCAYSV
jgi:hypothetical protein